MRRGRGRARLWAAAGLAAAGLASPALAHTTSVSSVPPAGAILRRSPVEVEVVFSEPLQGPRSRLSLLTLRGRVLAAGGVSRSRPHALVLSPPTLRAGVYRIRYLAVGADGHEVRGSFVFAVWPAGKGAPPRLAELGRARESGGAGRVGVARAVALAGIVPLLGLLLAPLMLGGRPPPQLVAGSAAFAAAGVVLSLTWASPPAQALATRWGRLWAAVGALALLSAAAGLAGRRLGHRTVLVGGACGGLAVALAATGHANAVAVPWAGVAADATHLLAASVWMGGLLYLLAFGRRNPEALGQVARRWGRPAVAAAAAAVASGIYQARARIPVASQLASTPYGRALILKLAVVGALLAAAGRVALASRHSALRTRLLATEGTFFAAAVGAAALLASLPPPPPPAPPSPVPLVRPLVLGDGLLTVVMTPYRPGPNRLAVLDRTEGSPLESRLREGGRQTSVPLAWGGGAWGGRVTLAPGGGWLEVTGAEGSASLRLAPPRRRARYRLAGPVSLEGPMAAECVSRLVGQALAVLQARSQGVDAELVARPLDGSRPRALLARDRPDAVVGPCAQDPGGVLRAAEGLGLPVFGEPGGGAWSVEPPPQEVAALYLRLLEGTGTARVAVLADGSPRAEAFAAGVAQAGGEEGVEVVRAASLEEARAAGVQAVVLAGGWEHAAGVLAELRRTPWVPERGVLMAPWLLTPRLLEPPPGEPPPLAQLSVGLTLDPLSALARTYLSLLRRLAPWEEPSSVGLRGYLEARLALVALRSSPDRAPLRRQAALAGIDLDPPRRSPVPAVQFFTPALFHWLPPELSPPASHGEHLWLEGGSLAPVSGRIGPRPATVK